MEETRRCGMNYQKGLETGLNEVEQHPQIHPKNKKFIAAYLRDAELGKTILKGQHRKIGIKRLVKSLGYLKKMSLEWFKKPFDEVTQEDMEDFVLNLERGILTHSKENKPYTSESQAGIKKFIKKFWKWLKGNNKHHPDMVEWIDTSSEEPDLPVITKEEFDILLSHTTHPAMKFLLVSFFVGGVRREEFFTLHIENYDISGDIPVMNLQVSKTYKRPIGIDLYSDIVLHYLKNVHPEKNNPKAYAYPFSDTNADKQLYRLLKKALPQRADEKNMSFHMFRRSSATYYAQYLSHFQMCVKYGWSMNSDMPQRYIKRANLVVKDISIAVKKAEKEKKDTDFQKMNIEFQAMKQEMEEMRTRMVAKEKEALIRQKDAQFIQLLMQRVLQNPEAEKEPDPKKKALITLKKDKELLGLLKEIKDMLNGGNTQ